LPRRVDYGDDVQGVRVRAVNENVASIDNKLARSRQPSWATETRTGKEKLSGSDESIVKGGGSARIVDLYVLINLRPVRQRLARPSQFHRRVSRTLRSEAARRLAKYSSTSSLE